MATAYQCAGKEKILSMFNNRGLDAWSMWMGKQQMLFTGIGDDELEAVLDMIEGGSAQVYTLKVYKGISDRDLITEKTPANGSFNFYVTEKRGRERSELSGDPALSGLISTVNGLKQQMDELRAGDSGPSKLGMLGEILDHPVLGSILEKIAMKVVDSSIIPQRPGIPAAIPMQAVGNISGDSDLMRSLEILKKHDPEIRSHLKRLAEIAEQEPQTFKMIISALDTMK